MARLSEEPLSWRWVYHPPPPKSPGTTWRWAPGHTQSGPEAFQFWLKEQKRHPLVLRVQPTFSSRPCPLTPQTPSEPITWACRSQSAEQKVSLSSVKLQSRQDGAKPLYFLLSVSSCHLAQTKATVVTYSKGRYLQPQLSGQRTKNENSQGRSSLKWPHHVVHNTNYWCVWEQN